MKPLKLKPAYKDYIWGGKKLRTKYGKETDITPLAESWELSCHKDGLSVSYRPDMHEDFVFEDVKNLNFHR